jgi:hypothetical protein
VQRLREEGVLHLSAAPDDFELLHGRASLTVYTFETSAAETSAAQHPFCPHGGMHAFHIPRSLPHRISVNARCLDDIESHDARFETVLRRSELGLSTVRASRLDRSGGLARRRNSSAHPGRA